MSKRSSKLLKKSVPPASSKKQARTKPFVYRAIEPGGEIFPGLPIVVHGPRGRIPMYGLVDTGADDSLFPYAIASALGIDEKDFVEEPCLTAAGPGKQYIWKGLEVEVQAMHVRFPVKGAFSKGLPSKVVLLGRHDFFWSFKVSFDERAKTFELEPYEYP